MTQAITHTLPLTLPAALSHPVPAAPAQGDSLASAIDHWTGRLLRDGYAIIPEIMPREAVSALADDLAARFAATPFSEGLFYGDRTRRFGRLLSHSPHAAAFVQNALILGIVERVLSPWCNTVQLNLTQALEIHPGSAAQVPHRDQDMWNGPKGEIEYLVNVMWPFSPYTGANGATVVWPGSHRGDPDAIYPRDQAIVAEMRPGAALLFLGSTLHGGGENRSRQVRRGMIVSYCLGWLKPFENQWLAYPPDIARRFPPALAGLIGYRQHRPNLGNYDGQCPSVLLKGPVPEFLHAVDELRPDQEKLIADYLAGTLDLAG